MLLNMRIGTGLPGSSDLSYNKGMAYKSPWAICDMCSFRYELTVLKPTSYGTLVCPTCHDGSYDKRNHPQNFPAPKKEEGLRFRNRRPDTSQSFGGGAFDDGGLPIDVGDA